MYRFDAFEYRPETSELRRDGELIPLQRQPARVLECLLRADGETVSREELKQVLWNGETFVDFDGSLNYCVREVRRALGDTARSPRFVETLPRLGYRFVAAVTVRHVPPARPNGSARYALFAAAAVLSFVAGLGIGHESYETELHARFVRWVHAGEPVTGR